MKQQTYRDQGLQLLLGALLLYLAGSSLSTMYEQCRLEKNRSKTCIMNTSKSNLELFLHRLSNTYEFTGIPLLSLSMIGAIGNEVVVVDASIADVNSSICLDVSTTTSAI
jgi:hypothetical protein